MSAGFKLNVQRIELEPVQKIKLKHMINKDGKAQRFFTHEVRRLCDPYVPFDKGPLKNTAVEDVHSITYVQPYAKKNYYENNGTGRQGTTKQYGRQGLNKRCTRGKLWDKRMLADKSDELVDSVANYVGGRSGK